MCGIAGFFGNFDLDLLKKMSSLIVHRGPDDAGEILLKHPNNWVGLAHRRLAIIDLSAEGRQPMTVNCSCCKNVNEMQSANKLWLTYNGEIYNYRELRAELEAKGHNFKSKTDSEVLLHLYSDIGPSMLERLNGIFAFALYDGKTQSLFLARDGTGTKPLYYSQTVSGFLFSSELKALLANKELPRNLDLTAIHYYLAYLWCPGQQTALSAVKKLQPGEAIIVQDRQIKKRWYFYDLPYEQLSLEHSEAVICMELDKCLTRAVERQMVSDVPVGAFLSGGLDSSAIVAIMRKLNPDYPIQCYSIDFTDGNTLDGSPNDITYARQVAKHLNVNLHVVDVKADMIHDLPRMLYHLDEPQSDPAPLNALLISEIAQRDGVKVLLSGAGGDDIFSGYRRHRALHSERWWTWLPFPILRTLSQLSGNLLDGHGTKQIMKFASVRRLAKLFAHCHLPIDRRIASYFMWGTESLRRNLYSSDMRNHIEKVDTAFPLLNSLKRIPREFNSLNKMLYLEGKHFLPDHNLNYTDKMSMATGVEVRVPLLDPDLIDLATRIPSNLKQKGGIGKYIFKKSMQSYLPKNIIYRPKTGFGVPLRKWLHCELQPLLNEVLSEASIKSRGIFDAKAITRLIKLDKNGQLDGTYTIFSALCIELWCRSFIDSTAFYY